MKLAPAFFFAVVAVPLLAGCAPAAPASPESAAAFAPSRPTDAAPREDLAYAALIEPAVAAAELSDATDDEAEAAPTEERPPSAPPLAPALPADPSAISACNEQPPQEALIRKTYVYRIDASPAEGSRRKKLHRAAIEYRTRRYGYVEGFGERMWNRYEPAHYSEVTKFFGIKVRMNKRVIPALRCVEAEIQRSCAAYPYKPHVLDGIRFRNTYHSGEITNHAYGIAIDIDPDKNSCCGCVPPLSDWPRCKLPSTSPYDRTSIPKCWTDSFAKYGFYWLGEDVLEDTMHFEFLGDPDKILKTRAPG